MTVKDLVQFYESTQESHELVDCPPPRLARFIHKSRNVDESDSSTRNQRVLLEEHPEASPTLLLRTGSSGSGVTLTIPPSSANHNSHHRPIPAQVLFARNASPVCLPKLDQYLASIAPPSFSSRQSLGGHVFPSLDQFAKTGTSLDDLENNSKISLAWLDRSSIFWIGVTSLINLLGSSALASFYSLQGLVNTLQIFALILSTIAHPENADVESSWRQLLLGTVPNILALNFAPALIRSLIFLTIIIIVVFLLLYIFYRSVASCDRYNSVEGLQQPESRGKQWGLVLVTFLLTVIYLPLSTMSVRVLVWSDELWPIPNPYENATSYPPVLPPLGPSSEFRDPLDFCWTTTMRRNEVNFAPIFLVLSAFVFIFYTIRYPISLDRVIRLSVPKVDKFTELGRPRNSVDEDAQYHRLIARDHNPFAFLYRNFRRGCATYLSNILAAKLTTLLIIAVIDSNNCLFRTFDRTKVPIVRQALLVISCLLLLLFHAYFSPFADPVDNASEWTSRFNYVSTSFILLLIALNIPGKHVFETYVLYSIYAITYGLSLYFLFINTSWMQRVIKKLSRRIDFSIDIFSPRLDISSNSIHTKRRIWQESLSALLLTDKDCRIPSRQTMVFAMNRDCVYPPYLLNFMGTPGERFAENLKIIRDVGSPAYIKAVALTSGPDSDLYGLLEGEIQRNYVGPDSYWKNPAEGAVPGCSNHFGNAWWLPFPPTLVIRYDDGRYAVLTEIDDLTTYINQNASPHIQRRRFVRVALRALEGRIVAWQYDHVEYVGTFMPWFGKHYEASTSRKYHRAVLHIKRHGHLEWHGLQLGSGFEVELHYSKSIKVTGEVIGLNEDFDLNPSLARFLELNRDLIDKGLREVQAKLSSYRLHCREECRWKSSVLTYHFMTFVYDQPRLPEECIQSSLQIEKDPKVRQRIQINREVFEAAYARLTAVSQSEAATWWYIFWDDLWRRNHDTISGLTKYASDFNPHFKTSIAYTPLSRPALDTFLRQRGLLHRRPQFFDVFHAGFLNKLYVRLNDAVFRNSKSAIIFHLGDDKRELDMEDVDVLTQGGPSTLGTGGGTDHDDPWILARPAYRWEGLLNDPPSKGGLEPPRKILSKFGVWFGVTPFWRSGSLSNGISLDLKLENGRYVLLQ